jgi:hypothetical protein
MAASAEPPEEDEKEEEEVRGPVSEAGSEAESGVAANEAEVEA